MKTQENLNTQDAIQEGRGFLVEEKTDNVTVNADEINDESVGEVGQGGHDDYQGRSNKERQADD